MSDKIESQTDERSLTLNDLTPGEQPTGGYGGSFITANGDVWYWD